jgi:hypothetical protein
VGERIGGDIIGLALAWRRGCIGMNSQVSIAQQPAREWLRTGAIAGVMLGILAVGWLLAKAPASVPSGPISVALGVAVTPPEGWQLGGRSNGGKTVLLSRGDASLAISVASDTNELAAVTRQRDEWLTGGTVTDGEVAPLSLRAGQPAVRFAYSGTFEHINSPVEGALTGVRGTNLVALFDGWSGFGGYGAVAKNIDAIIRATVIP